MDMNLSEFNIREQPTFIVVSELEKSDSSISILLFLNLFYTLTIVICTMW